VADGGHHHAIWWSRPFGPNRRLDELVELLEGIATILMVIDARLEDIRTILEER